MWLLLMIITFDLNIYWFFYSVVEREPVLGIAEQFENGVDVAVPERDGIAEIQPPPELELPVEEQEAEDIAQLPVVGPDVAVPGGDDDQRPRQRYHTLSPSPSPEQDQRQARVNNQHFFIL